MKPEVLQLSPILIPEIRDQLDELLGAASLTLTADVVARLDDASAGGIQG